MEHQARGLEIHHHVREKIPCLDGSVTTLDSSPEILRDEVPVLLVPGWSETIGTYEAGLEKMNEMGRRSIGIEFPRRGVFGVGEKGTEIDNEADRKAEAVYSVIKAKDDIDKFDIVAHSEGAVNALIAASFVPERVRNIVLVNPAGLIGQDTFLRLSTSFSKAIGQDMIRSIQSLRSTQRRGEFIRNFGNTTLETAKYVSQNPLRALSEVRYLVKSDTSDLVKQLTDTGINIGILANWDDPVFPEPRMREMLEGQDIAQFHTIAGGHNALNTTPRVHITEAVEMLERMRVRDEIGKERVDIVGDKLLLRE
ncbi:MAG: alpha/beta hydrolase [Candidatus Levybacteria bacterium]|nr:alpha/beta hydrolase [Candidatus Levybacteria bacterium]